MFQIRIIYYLFNMIAIKTWTLVTLFACNIFNNFGFRSARVILTKLIIPIRFSGTAYGQRKPPNYQQNEMPATSFSCKDKIIGGYYADPETSCQMFHVCVSVAGLGVSDITII